jgi:hypothetical protein
VIRQPLVTRFVMDRYPTPAVSFSVYFDRKPRLQTGEIEDIRASRMLATEFEAGGPLAEFPPQQDLGQRHFPAQLSRLADGGGGAV